MGPFGKNGGSACIACGCESLLGAALAFALAAKFAPRLVKRFR